MVREMETRFDLDGVIRKIQDFPRKGILFYDITGVLAHPEGFSYCIDTMLSLYPEGMFDAVAAVEARGFLFAAPFARERRLPLVPIRKKGKLPGKTIGRSFSLEYGEDEIEIHIDDVASRSRVLLVDDLVATGGTLKAAAELIVEAGASDVEIFCVIGLPFLDYGKVLEHYRVTTLIEYHGE